MSKGNSEFDDKVFVEFVVDEVVEFVVDEVVEIFVDGTFDNVADILMILLVLIC